MTKATDTKQAPKAPSPEPRAAETRPAATFAVGYTSVPPIWVPWRRVHVASFVVGQDGVSGIDVRADGVHINYEDGQGFVCRTQGWLTRELVRA